MTHVSGITIYLLTMLVKQIYLLLVKNGKNVTHVYRFTSGPAYVAEADFSFRCSIA